MSGRPPTKRQLHAQTSVCGHWAHLGKICGFLAQYLLEIPTFFVVLKSYDEKFS